MASSGSKRWFGNFAGRAESAAKRAISAARNHTPTTLEGAAAGATVGAAAGGVVVGAAAAGEGVALGVIGFTALGPAAGTTAASWMSSIALGNGVGVASGSMYAAFQSAAMGGAALVGMPVVIATVATCAVVGGVTCAYLVARGGDAPGAPDDSANPELMSCGGDAPGAPDDSANPELMSSEDEVLSEQEQSIEDDHDDEHSRQ